MNRRLSSVAMLALLIVVSDARDARACSCISGTPLCETLWNTPVVFAGEVIEIADVPGPSSSPFPANRLVRFRVEQSWREEVPREVEVRTGSGGGDCGYTFIKGVRYLVFARRNGEQLNTSICSPTKPISDAGEDLEYLKTAFKPSVAGRVFGRVTFQRRDPDAPIMPLKDYTVTLSDGRKERSTKTDADGRYVFNGVNTGVYGIRLNVPSTEHAFGKKEVELVDPRGCAAADFYVVFDGRISARLVVRTPNRRDVDHRHWWNAWQRQRNGDLLHCSVHRQAQGTATAPSRLLVRRSASGNQNSQCEESRQVH